ncbi:MAG: hypothetical protein WBN66_04985 [Smithella sp.]
MASIFLLVCTSFVYAEKKAITEADLNQVTAESGITIGMDVTVRMVIGSDNNSTDYLGIYQNGSKEEGIFANDLKVYHGDSPGFAANENVGFPISTNVTMDVGSSGTRTWLDVSGLTMPAADNALGVRLRDIKVRDAATTDYYLFSHVYLLGLNIGRDMTKLSGSTPIRLQPSAEPFIRISNNGNSGIELQSEMAVFLDDLRVHYAAEQANTSAHWFQVNNVCLYGNTNFDPVMQGEYIIMDQEYNWLGNPIYSYTTRINFAGDPQNWNYKGPLYGNAKIGGFLPTYTYDTSSFDATVNGYKYFPATIDVGSSGTTTLLRMNLPMAMSTKIAEMNMGRGSATTNLGSTAIDNAALYKVQVTLRNTY